MLADETLQLLRCLVTGSGVQRADETLLKAVNQEIAAGRVSNLLGQQVDGPLEAALVNAELTHLYVVENDVPQMLREEAIDIRLLSSVEDRSLPDSEDTA